MRAGSRICIGAHQQRLEAGRRVTHTRHNTGRWRAPDRAMCVRTSGPATCCRLHSLLFRLPLIGRQLLYEYYTQRDGLGCLLLLSPTPDGDRLHLTLLPACCVFRYAVRVVADGVYREHSSSKLTPSISPIDVVSSKQR